MADRPEGFADHVRLHEVADRYRVAKATILRWVRDCEFPAPAELPRGLRLWDPDDLDRFEQWCVRRGVLSQQGKPPTSELPPDYRNDPSRNTFDSDEFREVLAEQPQPSEPSSGGAQA